MKQNALIGIVLIVLGVLALSYQGFTYVSREKVIDLGPIQASVDRERTVPIAPIVGAIALAGGLYLLFANRRTA